MSLIRGACQKAGAISVAINRSRKIVIPFLFVILSGCQLKNSRADTAMVVDIMALLRFRSFAVAALLVRANSYDGGQLKKMANTKWSEIIVRPCTAVPLMMVSSFSCHLLRFFIVRTMWPFAINKSVQRTKATTNFQISYSIPTEWHFSFR